MVEALEVMAVAAAAAAAAAWATAAAAAAPMRVAGATEGVPEGAVEVVMGAAAAAAETSERAKAEASQGAETVVPPNCRSSKLLPTLPTRISWSRGKGCYDSAPVPSLESFSSPLICLFPMGLSSLANKVHSIWGGRWVTASNRSIYGGPWLAVRTAAVAHPTHTPHAGQGPPRAQVGLGERAATGG